MYSRCRSAFLIFCAAASVGAAAAERELRICADPDNLPYSHETAGGFENRIAEVVARDLNARLTFTWQPQRRGFVRKSLNANVCDVIMGVPRDFELVRTTAPYYRSTYEFVSRNDGSPAYESFDDPRLKTARIGVQLVGNDLATTPPGHALVARGILENVIGYVPYGDVRQAQRMIDALVRGEIDVALIWGPQAAYYARRAPTPLKLSPAHAPADLKEIPFEYSMSMGVRKRDAALAQALDGAIARRQAEIDAILSEYAVPRMSTAVAKAQP